MLPSESADRLNRLGHEATTPRFKMSDADIIQVAVMEQRVIITENFRDFAPVRGCPVLFIRRSWWSKQTLASRLATAVHRWAVANPRPGYWAQWLPAEFR